MSGDLVSPPLLGPTAGLFQGAADCAWGTRDGFSAITAARLRPLEVARGLMRLAGEQWRLLITRRDSMPFRKTAEQHRQMARLLREAGNETLANQHDLIALAIEHRQRRVDEAAQQASSENPVALE